MVSLWTSLRIMIGDPLLGSIINALIFTSISITRRLTSFCRAVNLPTVRKGCWTLLRLLAQGLRFLPYQHRRESLPPCGKLNDLSCLFQTVSFVLLQAHS